MNAVASWVRKLFTPKRGDARLVYRGCRMCSGDGCTKYTKEEIDAGVPPLVYIDLNTTRAIFCHAAQFDGPKMRERKDSLARLSKVIKSRKPHDELH